MKRGGGVHTVPVPDSKRWQNVRNGKQLTRHNSKEIAVAAGRQIARELEVEHTIHNENGQIGEANSYGNDPFPPKDS